MSNINDALMPVAVRGEQPTSVASRISHLESPYDVTAEDWHAHWHDEDEVEREKRLNRHNWYPKQEDVSAIGYRGIQKVNIEYATADHERLNRHRVPFATQNPKKADNQTSHRLFGAARPQVRLPPPSPATSKTNARLPAVVPAAPVILPHLRGSQTSRPSSRSGLGAKREVPVEHTQSPTPHRAAPSVKSGRNPVSSPKFSNSTENPVYQATKPVARRSELVKPSGFPPPSVEAATPPSSEESQAALQGRPLQDAGPTASSTMPSVTLRKTAEDSCPICEGSYTHDDPGMRTPCCGLAIHELCNYYALEDHAVCYGCHRDQVPAGISEPNSDTEVEGYIRHFDSTPQTSSTCSLKSEQAGTSSRSSGVMTLREYVESHAGLRSATSSLEMDASSASFSWLSSVEDEGSDDDHSFSDKGSTFTFVTGPSSPQAASASSCEGPDSILAEALNDSQPSPPDLSSGEPTTAEALGILDGATEHLVNACRKVGMYVSEDHKDTIVERILVALEDPSCTQLTSRAGSVEARPLDPPLPINELELAMKSTTPSPPPMEQCPLPRSSALRAPSSGSSPDRAMETKKRVPSAPFPEEIRGGGRKEDMKTKPKPLVTYEIIGYG